LLLDSNANASFARRDFVRRRNFFFQDEANLSLPSSITTPLVIIVGRWIVKESERIIAIGVRRTVPIHVDITHMSVDKANDIFSIIKEWQFHAV
jgi:hypothetical protein